MPVNCSSGCQCHYFRQRRANVLNCSSRGIANLNYLEIPEGTTWLIADSNEIDYLCPKSSVKNLAHISIQTSHINSICEDFFSKLVNEKTLTSLNLAHNNISRFSKYIQNINSLQEVYLAGNPIDCNCDMMWFAQWLNSTATPSGVRIVKDYKGIKCFGGEWDGVTVSDLDERAMGCIPFPA